MFNKKAISELISFTFITLIIIVASSSAYVYSKTLLDENVNLLDRNRMQSYLKSFDAKINHIKEFDDATTIQELTFRKGLLTFNQNQIKYQSLLPFTDSVASCFGVICYEGYGGSELLYINISSSYVFSTNLTLEPGTYILIMNNNKTVKKIGITFR